MEKNSSDHVHVRDEPQVPTNFSSVLRNIIREICLERTTVPTLNSMLDRLQQKRANDFEHLNLHDNNNSILAT